MVCDPESISDRLLTIPQNDHRYLARGSDFKPYFSTRSFNHRRALAIIIESGMVYSSAMFVVIILAALKTSVVTMVYYPVAQLTVGTHLPSC